MNKIFIFLILFLTACQENPLSSGSGDSSLFLSYRKRKLPPIISFGTINQIYVGNVISINPSVLKDNGFPITNCEVSPPLPTGLSIDITNCEISGTPTVTEVLTTYTIKSTNSIGETQTQVSFSVLPPTAPTLTYGGALTATIGTVITIPPATFDAGSHTTTCAVIDPLPAGLTLNTTTCVVSGNPTTVAGTANYRIRPPMQSVAFLV
jgi:hypothetical protein